MKSSYLKHIFWFYYLISILFILTSFFSVLFPVIPKTVEPTGLSTISPFFFVVFYIYPFICGLVGVVLNFDQNDDKVSKIIGAIFNFVMFFSLTCGFYFLSILIFPSLISSIFQGQTSYQFGFLIGFNLVNILQFYLFEFLKNRKKLEVKVKN